MGKKKSLLERVKACFDAEVRTIIPTLQDKIEILAVSETGVVSMKIGLACDGCVRDISSHTKWLLTNRFPKEVTDVILVK